MSESEGSVRQEVVADEAWRAVHDGRDAYKGVTKEPATRGCLPEVGQHQHGEWQETKQPVPDEELHAESKETEQEQDPDLSEGKSFRPQSREKMQR